MNLDRLFGVDSNFNDSKLPERYLKGMRQGVIAGLTANKGERTLLELTRDYYSRRKA